MDVTKSQYWQQYTLHYNPEDVETLKHIAAAKNCSILDAVKLIVEYGMMELERLTTNPG